MEDQKEAKELWPVKMITQAYMKQFIHIIDSDEIRHLRQ